MSDKLKLEDELNKLEEIIKTLEDGDLDLDSAIEKYTEAMKIAKSCQKKLDEAEEKVTKIIRENNELEDFDVE